MNSYQGTKQDLLMLGGWVEKIDALPINTSPHIMYTKEEDGVKYIRHAVEKCPCILKKTKGFVHWDFNNTSGGHNLRHKRSDEIILPPK